MSREFTFKVLFHQGEEAGVETKGATGRLGLTDEAICITGKSPCVISFEFLRGVELLRMPKIGSVIKVTHANGTLFVTAVRFSLFGLRNHTDKDATRRLVEELRKRIPVHLPEPGASFLASLETVPWFSSVGHREETTDVDWLTGWESWPGPEDWSVAALIEEDQALQDEILAATGEHQLEFKRLFDVVSDAVVTRARRNLPDSSGDPWHGPSFAVLQAAETAGLVALCLQTRRPIPARLDQRWKWFLRGHWPSGYAWVPDGVEVERLVVY